MRNLHNINDKIPLWVKQMVLAFGFDSYPPEVWIFDPIKQTAYPEAHKGMVRDRAYDYNFWVVTNRWDSYMKKVDVTKFKESFVIIKK